MPTYLNNDEFECIITLGSSDLANIPLEQGPQNSYLFNAAQTALQAWLQRLRQFGDSKPTPFHTTTLTQQTNGFSPKGGPPWNYETLMTDEGNNIFTCMIVADPTVA